MVQGMHINWSQLKMMSTTPVLKCGTFQYIDSKKNYCMHNTGIRVVRPMPFERPHHREHTGFWLGPK
jgi:hypothetical protein